jgi:hypothetical protein
MTLHRKTNRRYRFVFDLIRDVAYRRPTFTVNDLTFALDKTQAMANCNIMVSTGALKRVKRGGLGRDAEPAVYQRAVR